MAPSMDRFVEKVAVVTGASAGIGAAIVEHMVKSGVIVAGLARRVKRIEKLATELSGEKGKLYAFGCDITKEEEIMLTIQNIVKKLGNIHILINNAGVMLKTDLINGDTNLWKITIDTNILGLCIVTREVVLNMKANGTKGHIVHINSILGHIVKDYPGFNIHGATKFAVTALTETLRLDLNREKLPIKVTSVSPGFVKSELQAMANGKLPFPPIHTSDVADAVMYTLATPPHVNVKEVMLQAVGS